MPIRWLHRRNVTLEGLAKHLPIYPMPIDMKRFRIPTSFPDHFANQLLVQYPPRVGMEDYFQLLRRDLPYVDAVAEELDH